MNNLDVFSELVTHARTSGESWMCCRLWRPASCERLGVWSSAESIYTSRFQSLSVITGVVSSVVHNNTSQHSLNNRPCGKRKPNASYPYSNELMDAQNNYWLIEEELVSLATFQRRNARWIAVFIAIILYASFFSLCTGRIRISQNSLQLR
jgi:hypothetical protein